MDIAKLKHMRGMMNERMTAQSASETVARSQQVWSILSYGGPNFSIRIIEILLRLVFPFVNILDNTSVKTRIVSQADKENLNQRLGPVLLKSTVYRGSGIQYFRKYNVVVVVPQFFYSSNAVVVLFAVMAHYETICPRKLTQRLVFF